MSTSAATRTRTVAPSVNLLPPEFAEREKLRKLQAVLAVFVVVAVLIIGMLYLTERSAAVRAQEELDVSRATGMELLQERSKYAHVPAALKEMQAAEGTLSQAMGDEVRWSTYLARLSRSVPKTVWLSDMTATTQMTGGTAAPGAGTPSVLGQVTFKGYALRYSDVAKWLEALEKEKGYTDAWGQSIKLIRSEATDRTVVGFDSSVTVTSEAKSGRYQDRGTN